MSETVIQYYSGRWRMVRKAFERIVNFFAFTGGLILCLLVIMSIISIVGRKLYSAPIRGDMELMEIFAALSIAAFLPICELRGMHIKADAFTMKAPPIVKLTLDIISHILCCIVALFLVWRTSLQLFDNYKYGDVSTLLSIPMWLPLFLIIPSLTLFALSSIFRITDIVQLYKRIHK